MKQEKGQPYEIFQRSVQHRNRWFGIHPNMRKRWIRLIAEHNRLRQQTKLRFTLRRLFSMKTRLLTMSASIDKKIQVLFYLILRSAPKQVVQAQCAAQCKPRRIHDSRHKKRHRDFSKEVDSLGVGQFSNIQQNAALCSTMIN